MDKVRWGILGTGAIARKFATGLAALPDAALAAVGSRAQATADKFADEFKAPRRHASYEGLANDPDVDAVYVATPHPFHKENTLLCLKAGKPVLCEKPFTINAAEAAAVIRVARKRKVFLMEAMWTRFIPVMRRVREWIQSGAIGDVRLVEADFGFRAAVRPEGRLFNAELGGGALLDVGVYPISFASMVFGGPPKRIASMTNLGETGIDEQSAMVFGYEKGQMAVLYTAVRLNTPQGAWILGTDGRIEIPPAFWKPERATLYSGSGKETVEMPMQGNGYNYEAAEVMRCVREGKLESETMTLDETLSIVKTMDRVRDQWGLKYPME